MTERGLWVDELASWISNLPVGEMPDRVIEQGSLVLADSVGAILAGASDPAFLRLASVYANGGGASVLGTGLSAPPERAAMLNGMSGTIVELDEGNYAAGGHPGIHAVPAALATAEQLGASGVALLDAVILGYEIGARIGQAGRLLPEVHSHGTWGTIGAAVAAARLRGFDAARMAAAMRIAAPLSIAASGAAGIKGASVRASYAALAASNGLLACDMAEAGFTGEADAIDIVYDRILGRGFDGNRVVAEIGASWIFDHGFFKLYASCRETHGAIEAWRAIPDADLLDLAAIRSIRILTFDPASSLSVRRPTSPLAARFSIPFVLASFILHGRAGAAEFSENAIQEEQVLALAARIEVQDVATAEAVEKRSTEILVDATDRIVSAVVSGAEGDASSPVGRERLRLKFQNEALLGERGATEFDNWADLGRNPRPGSVRDRTSSLRIAA